MKGTPRRFRVSTATCMEGDWFVGAGSPHPNGERGARNPEPLLLSFHPLIDALLRVRGGLWRPVVVRSIVRNAFHRPHRWERQRSIETKGRYMGIIAFVILGLIGGAIAKAILPGDDPGGFIVTAIIGVVGALLGGFLAAALFDADPLDEFFDISSWLTAIVGSLILLGIYRLVVNRDRGALRA